MIEVWADHIWNSSADRVTNWNGSWHMHTLTVPAIQALEPSLVQSVLESHFLLGNTPGLLARPGAQCGETLRTLTAISHCELQWHSTFFVHSP